MSEWLLEQGDRESKDVRDAFQDVRGRANATSGPASRPLAVFLKPLVVLETRKWFGAADLRLDVLVVSAGGADIYQPKTLRFPRVNDGDDLAGTENGIAIYYGKPAHFLSICVLLARETQDSDDLAKLLQAQAGSAPVKAAVSALGSTALPGAELAAVEAGFAAALALGNVAYEVLKAVSPKCLGLYRAAWLGGRHRFGLGRHPPRGVHEVKDFQFAYSIFEDEAEGGR